MAVIESVARIPFRCAAPTSSALVTPPKLSEVVSACPRRRFGGIPRGAPLRHFEPALRRCFGRIHCLLGLFRHRTPVSEDLCL
jgi:hypothetical protein